jgi:dihydroflavonol-4-reductase
VDLGRILEEVSGVRAPRFVTPMWLARVGLPFITLGSKLTGSAPLYTSHSLHAVRNHRLISCAKAEQELGYHPRPLTETLAAACEWYRANGMV